MSMRRAWRRAMLRGIPLWARGYAVKMRLEKQLRRDRCVPGRKKAEHNTFGCRTYKAWVRKSIAASIAVAVLNSYGLTYAGTVQIDSGNNISTTGRTDTVLTINGSTTDITTGTIKGSNALNSFDKFNVAENHFVNLIIPESVTKLLNFIHGGQSNINGTLSSLLANGSIGGNVYFLNPSGLVVGATGSVNVGKLTMATPSALSMGLMESAALASDSYNIDNALSMANYSDAAIISNGKITAGDLKFRTGGDVTLTHQVLVNTDVATGTAVTKDADGNVEIIAKNVNIGNSTSPTKLLASGDIKVEASKEAAIGNWGFGSLKTEINVENAEITGKSVKMETKVKSAPPTSDDKGVIPDQAYLVKDGLTGDNEILSTVTSLLGSFTDGAGFTYIEGEANININHSTIKSTGEGVDEAGKPIGNISLKATSAIESGLEGETGTGNIMGGVTSSKTAIHIADSTLEAKGDIKVNAEAKNTFKVSNKAGEEGTKRAQEAFLQKVKEANGIEYQAPSAELTNETIGAMVGVSETKADINITGGTKITSAKDTEISTAAISELTVQNVMGGNNDNTDNNEQEPNKKGGFSVGTNALSTTIAVGTTDAAVNIGSGVKVDSGNDAKLSAVISAKSESANSMIPQEAQNDKQPQKEDPAESILGLGLAFGQTKGTANVNTAAGSSVAAAKDITISTEAIKDIHVKTDVEGAKKLLATSAVVSLSDVKAATTVAGTVFAGNDLGVTSKVGVTGNEMTSNSKILVKQDDSGSGGSGKEKPDTNANNKAGSSFTTNLLKLMKKEGRFNGVEVEEEASPGTGTKTTTPGFADENGLNASVAVGIHNNSATVKIASTGSDKVSVFHDLAANAEVKDAATNMATAFQEVETTNPDTKTTKTAAAGKKNAIAAAVIYGSYANNSEAVIGDGAIVNVGQNLTVSSKTLLPYKDNITKIAEAWNAVTSALGEMDGLNKDTVDGVVDASKDLKNAVSEFVKNPKQLVNSWAQSASEAENVAGAASINVFELDNSSKATIGEGAKINQSEACSGVAAGQGTVTVKAANEIANVNFDGVIKLPELHSENQPDDGIGGSIQASLYKNTANAAIGSKAVVKADEVSVTADNRMTSINMTVAGGSAKSVGVNGTLGYNQIDNTTKALITDAIINTAGDVNLSATDNTLNVNIGGGFATGGTVGIGATLAVNNTSRNTETGLSGNITAGGDIIGTAVNEGSLVAVSMAGSMTREQKEAVDANATAENPTGSSSSDDADGGLDVANALKSFVSKSSVNADKKTDNAEALDKPTDVITKKTSKERHGDVSPGYRLLADIKLTDGGTETKIKDSTTGEEKIQEERSAKSGISMAGNVSVNLSGEKVSVQLGNKDSANDSIFTAKNIDTEAKNASSTIALSGTLSLATNGSSSGGSGTGGRNGIPAPGAITGEKDSYAIAGAFMMNKIAEETTAKMVNTTVNATGNVTTKAMNEADILSVALSSASASKGYGVAGQVSLNMINNDTTAGMEDSLIVQTKDLDNTEDKKISIFADDSANIVAVAGAVGYGDKAGIGASIGVNLMGNNTVAGLKNTSINAENSSLDVQATEDSDIISVTAAVSASTGKMAGAFAATGNAINNDTVAYLDNETLSTKTITVDKAVQVSAADTSGVVSVAGGAAIATGTSTGTSVGGNNSLAIGAAAGVSVVDNLVSTFVGQDTEVSGSSVTLKSNGGMDITTIAAGGAGAGKNGIAGSTNVNVLKQAIKSSIGTGAKITAVKDVVVSAINDVIVVSVAGALAIGGKNGVGGGADVEIISTSTEAQIGDRAIVNAGDDVEVTARSKERVTIATVAAAGGGAKAVAGAADVNVMDTLTKATIGTGAKVTADDSIALTANDDSVYNLIGGSIAASGFNGGEGTSGMVAGGAVAVGVINKTTTAIIGDKAEVNVLVKGDGVIANNGVLNTEFKEYKEDSAESALAVEEEVNVNTTGEAKDEVGISNDVLTKDRVTSVGQVTIKGLVVSATSANSVRTAAAGASLDASSQGNALVGAVSVNVFNNTTEAAIGAGAKINQQDQASAGDEQNVLVGAGSDFYHLAVAGGVGGSGGSAVGAGADVGVINNTTKAHVDSGAKVAAKDDVEVLAAGDATSVAVSAAGAASTGRSAVAGSVDINVINNTVEAYVADSSDANSTTIAAGDLVKIKAKNTSNMYTAAGGAAIGSQTAIGMAVNAGVLTSNTKAYIGDYAVVDGKGTGVAVDADTMNNAVNVAAGLGISTSASALAASVAVDVGNANTEAYIGNNAKINTATIGESSEQDVIVNANDTTKRIIVGATMAGSSQNSIGAGVLVEKLNHSTSAYIDDGAEVEAKDDVKVTAQTKKELKGFTASVAASGSTGVAGSVSVFYMGSQNNSDASEALQTAGGGTDVTTIGTTLLDELTGQVNHQLAEYENSRIYSQKVDEHYGDQIQSKIENNDLQKGTSAYIGKAEVSGGEVEIKAADHMDVTNITGGIAGGVNNAVGGSVGVIVSKNAVNAFIDQGAVVDAGGAVSIGAYGNTDVLNVVIGGGVSGYAGVGAVAPVSVVNESVNAGIGNKEDIGTDVTKVTAVNGSVTVEAENDLKLSNNIGSLGVAISGVGAGVGINTAVLSSDTTAFIDKNAVTGAGDDIVVRADSAEDVDTIAVGLAGGVAGVVGSGNVQIMNTDIQAKLGGTATAGDSILVEADDDSSIESYMVSLALGGVGVGGAVDVEVINKNVSAAVTDGATLQANAKRDGVLAKTGEFVQNGIFTGKRDYANVGEGKGDYNKNSHGTYSYVGAGKGNYTLVEAEVAPSYTTATDSDDETGKTAGKNNVVSDMDTKLMQASSGMVKGVAVTATTRNDVRNIEAGASVGGTAVTGSAGVNIISNNTIAALGDNVKINENNTKADVAQELNVLAATDMRYTGVAGAVGGGMSAGIGASGDVAVISNNTAATVGTDTLAKAKKAVNVVASSSQTMQEVAATAGIGLGAGAAGSVVVNNLTNITTAATGVGSRLVSETDSVNVKAQNETIQRNIAGSLGVGSSVGGGLAFTVNNVAQTTTASLNGDVTAEKDVNVAATNTENFIVSNVGIGAGGTAGVGASVAVNVSKAMTTALIGNGTIVADNGAVNVKALNDIDRTTVGMSLGGGLGLGAAAGVDVGVFTADTTASIDNAAVTALGSGGAVHVTAENKQDITSYTGSVGLGTVGLGGSVAVYSFGTSADGAKGATNDYVGQANGGTNGFVNNIIDDDNGIGGYLSANDKQKLSDFAVSTDVTPSAGTTAKINGSAIDTKKLDVNAIDTLNFDAIAAAAGGGIAGMGASIGVVTADNDAAAYVTGGSIKVADKLNVVSSLSPNINLKTVAGAGGIGLALAGSGAVITETGDSDAYIVNVTSLKTGAVRVTADADKTVDTKVIGASASLGLSAAGSLSQINISGTTDANLGSTSTASVEVDGDIDVEADSSLQVSSDVKAPAIGSYAAGLAVNTINTNTTTNATVADNSAIQKAKKMNLKANVTPVLSAQSDGKAYGLGALGLSSANITDSTQVFAGIGENVSIGQRTGVTVDKVNIEAKKSQPATGYNDYTNVNAGAGGLVGGSAAKSSIVKTDSTTATIGKGAKIKANTLTLNALHDDSFNHAMDTTGAGLVGGSGGVVNNTVKSTVETIISENAVLDIGVLDVDALNKTTKAWLNNGYNVDAGSGGALAGSAVVSTTNIDHDTAAKVNDGVIIRASALTGDSAVTIDAASNITAKEKNKLSAGGAISAAVVDTKVTAATSTKVTTDGAGIETAHGDIRFGARNIADIDSENVVDAYGVAGAPAGSALAQYVGSTNINTIGSNLTANDGDVQLLAGKNTSGEKTALKAYASVELWNKSAIPINSDPDPYAYIKNDAELVVGEGSNVRSVRDIYLTATSGENSAKYYGVGKDPYREAASEVLSDISEALGGDGVSFNITGGKAKKEGTGTVTINGNVETGIKRNQELTLDFNDSDTINEKGNLESGKIVLSSSATEAFEGKYDLKLAGVASTMMNRYNELLKLKADAAGDTVAVAAYQAEIDYLQNKMVEMGIASWSVKDGVRTFCPGTPTDVNDYDLALVMKNEAQNSLNKLEQAGQLADTLTTGVNAVKDRDAKTAALAAAETEKTTAITKQQYLNAVVEAKKNYDNNKTEQNLKALTDAQNSYSSKYGTVNWGTVNLSALQTQVAGEVSTKINAVTQANTELSTAKTKVAQVYETDSITIDAAKAYQMTGAVGGSTLTMSYNEIAGSLVENLADQITALQNTIADLNAKITYTDSAGADPSNALYLSKEPISLLANYITITDDVTADRGSIFIQADNVTGSDKGNLKAPGDASITITNNTPAFLNIEGDLTISDGGFVYMNGASVNNVNDIKALNKNQVLAVNLVDSNIITKKTTGAKEPTITINTTFNPVLYQETSAGVTRSKYLTPDIHLNSYLYNPDGKVTVNNLKGSIYLNEGATITSVSADIVANNGDYVQSYNPGYNHIDGTPTIETAGADCGKYNTKQGTGDGIIANGNILISAKYLNINGTVQSGIAEWKLEIPTDTSTLRDYTTGKTLAQLQAEYDSGHGNETGLYQLAKYSGDERIRSKNEIIDGGYLLYDAKNKSFYISGIEVRGGSIDLYGQIMNTNATNSAAQLKALAGYGTINIINNSNYGIVIGDLDTGLGKEGKITINDFTGNVQKTTQYISNGTNIKVKEITTSYDSNGNKTGSTTSERQITGSKATSYQPTDDLTYAFTTGQDYTQVEYYVYEKNDIIGIKISDKNHPGDKYRTDVGEKKKLSNGTYLLNKNIGDNYYTSKTESLTLTDPVYDTIDEWSKRYWWSLGIAGKYHIEYTKSTGKKDITTNYVKADNPIGISFFGDTRGTINVNNQTGTNVNLRGTINNAAGTTSISNLNGSIWQGSDTGLLITKDLNLMGQNLGSDEKALRVMTGGMVNATATNGDINLDQVRGDFKVGTINAAKSGAASTVNLTSNGSIVNAGNGSLINADRINLVATNGTIGRSDSALCVNTGGDRSTGLNANYGLDAKAYGNINIEKASGDLLIDQVVSTTGDVRIKAGGALVDNQVEQQIDDRSWEELQAFWDSLQLRNTEGNTRVKDAEETYALNKNLQYMEYWTLKTQMKDGKYKASADEIAALNSIGSSVSEYEKAHTERYNSLVKEGVSTWTDSYDQNWSYTLTETDKKNIGKNAYWTDSELSIAISPGVLKDITDTNYIIKAPNVSGKNVTLLSDSIGSTTKLDTINLSKLNPKDLTPEQKVALAAAERNDFSFSKDESTGDVLVTINQKNPVNIALSTGSLTAIADNYVYLASEGDLLINRVDTTALRDINNTTAGEIRIKAAGSITGVKENLITLADDVAISDDNNRYHVGGTDVVIESGTGKIGGGTNSEEKEDERLIFDNDGALITRSEEDTYLAHKRKMYIDNMYSRGNINLTAVNGVELAHTASTSVMADCLNMSVSGSGPLSGGETRTGIGTADQAIGIIVGCGGLNADTSGTGGTEEDASIYLKGGKDELRINQVNAGSGDIVITTAGSIISGNTPLSTTPGRSLPMANADTAYDLIGNQLNITSDSVGTANKAVTSNVNAMNITAKEMVNIHNYKDVAIEKVSADTIKLEAEGSIVNAAADASGFTGHDITLLANGKVSDIGTKDSYMKISPVDKSGEKGIVQVMAGRNMFVNLTNNIGSGVGFAAGAGDVNILTDYDINTERISAANGAIKVMTKGSLTAENLQAKKNIDLSVGQDLTVTNSMTSDEGNITATVQRDIAMESADTGNGDITLAVADGNVALRSMKAVGNTIQITAKGNITDSSSNDETNLQAKDIDLKAETGSIGTENNSLTLQSTGKVNLEAQKEINIVGVGDMAIGKAASKNADITIKLEAGGTTAGQSLDLTIDKAETAKGMSLRADNITITDLQQNNVSTVPMRLDFSGATQPMVNNVAVNLTSKQGVVVDKLKAKTVHMNAATDDIWFTDALVGERMELATNQVTVLDARRHSSIAAADILLNTEGENFDFSLVDKDMTGIENLVHKSSDITYNGGFNTLNIGINTASYQMATEQKRQILAHEGHLVGEENGMNGQPIATVGLVQGKLVDSTKLMEESSQSEEKATVDEELSTQE